MDPRNYYPLIKKVVFYFCFLPFIFILISAIYSAINGSQGLCIFGGCPYTYGMKAFWETLYLFAIVYSAGIPVLPLCLAYIIYYLISESRRKNSPSKPSQSSRSSESPKPSTPSKKSQKSK